MNNALDCGRFFLKQENITMVNHNHTQSNVLKTFLGSRVGFVFLCLVAVIGLYLLLTHTGHIVSALPYLILLACPLLHLFMYGGHHHSRPKE
jgi:hypothetical protein